MNLAQPTLCSVSHLLRGDGETAPGKPRLGEVKKPTSSFSTRRIISWLWSRREGEKDVKMPQEMALATQEISLFYLDRGIAFYDAGEYSEALVEFRTALRLNWRDERAANWIAAGEWASTPDGDARVETLVNKAA